MIDVLNNVHGARRNFPELVGSATEDNVRVYPGNNIFAQLREKETRDQHLKDGVIRDPTHRTRWHNDSRQFSQLTSGNLRIYRWHKTITANIRVKVPYASE
jgi:hypothetical protein